MAKKICMDKNKVAICIASYCFIHTQLLQHIVFHFYMSSYDRKNEKIVQKPFFGPTLDKVLGKKLA